MMRISISKGVGGMGKMLACVSSCAHMCISSHFFLWGGGQDDPDACVHVVMSLGKMFPFVGRSSHCSKLASEKTLTVSSAPGTHIND